MPIALSILRARRLSETDGVVGLAVRSSCSSRVGTLPLDLGMEALERLLSYARAMIADA